MYNIEKTTEEIAKDSAIQITNDAEKSVNDTDYKHEQMFKSFWYPTNCTTQDICNVLGNQAYKIFKDSYETQLYLAKVKPNYVQLVPPREYTINENGSVLIGDWIVPEVVENEEEIINDPNII
jgi:hypothetical protein